MRDKGIAFVIMQIGNPELDKLYDEIYVPAIEKANLIPKRIDQDNSGYLLKKEIISFIEDAEIIIADLTNERPNCYLEIGYAMGLDKFQNLIFTVREDHFPESKNFQKGGPKIHFDVSGYEILSWDKNELNKFKNSLTNKISRRLTTVKPQQKGVVKKKWDQNWLKDKREYAQKKMDALEIGRQMEVLVSTEDHISLSQTQLLEIANECQMDILGWPIAPVIPHLPIYSPKPKVDGLYSEIIRNEGVLSFDYTYYLKSGKIFIAKSIFEEHHFKNCIIVPIRIKRSTELLMYILKYYYKCGLSPSNKIEIEVRFCGIKDNEISYGSEGFVMRSYKSKENESYCKLTTTLGDIENNLTDLVYQLSNELFVLFDFFSINEEQVESIVNSFVNEKRNAF
ncbi:hypothetical protein [Marinifilum caeruleilacunae]|uniref:EF-hand domain-containing protein n=1 Tax=Marinifilum caeruleilacunae TaxID=2499076 RepID=A0ABX1WY34_9BACT|nr:hypothetical protein [Marinifilum caeruleilacunae]NOU61065.1 hypothetical protein [Marinifilum caeruleilacunae]